MDSSYFLSSRFPVWFWALIGANKGLLTFIQDSAEGVVSVMDFDCCDDCVVVRHRIQVVIVVDIQSGKTEILWMPWGIIRGKEVIEHQTVFSPAFIGTTDWWPLLCLIFQLYTHSSDRLFKDGVKTICTKYFCTMQNTVVNTFPDFVLIFLV